MALASEGVLVLIGWLKLIVILLIVWETIRFINGRHDEHDTGGGQGNFDFRGFLNNMVQQHEASDTHHEEERAARTNMETQQREREEEQEREQARLLAERIIRRLDEIYQALQRETR